jgi:hypothetical protein
MEPCPPNWNRRAEVAYFGLLRQRVSAAGAQHIPSRLRIQWLRANNASGRLDRGLPPRGLAYRFCGPPPALDTKKVARTARRLTGPRLFPAAITPYERQSVSSKNRRPLRRRAVGARSLPEPQPSFAESTHGGACCVPLRFGARSPADETAGCVRRGGSPHPTARCGAIRIPPSGRRGEARATASRSEQPCPRHRPGSEGALHVPAPDVAEI